MGLEGEADDQHKYFEPAITCCLSALQYQQQPALSALGIFSDVRPALEQTTITAEHVPVGIADLTFDKVNALDRRASGENLSITSTIWL